MRNEEQITQFYIGYFSRAADHDGLSYWDGRADAGMTTGQIAASFAVQPEFAAIYGGLSNSALIDRIYDNLFDRDPDAEGLAYWTNELNNGVSPGQLMVNILSGAQGADRLKLDNAAIVANDWTEATAHIPFDIEQAMLAISTIDEIQPVSNGGITINILSDELMPWESQLNASLATAWAGWSAHFPNDVQIQIDVIYQPRPAPLGQNEFVASALPSMEVLTESGYTQTGLIQEINTGRDPNGFQADGVLKIHMAPARLFAELNPVEVFQHEFGHMLAYRYSFSNVPTGYDRWVTQKDGVTVFSGPETIAAYGGPVQLVNKVHVADSALTMFPVLDNVGLIGAVDIAMLRDSGLL